MELVCAFHMRPRASSSLKEEELAELTASCSVDNRYYSNGEQKGQRRVIFLYNHRLHKIKCLTAKGNCIWIVEVVAVLCFQHCKGFIHIISVFGYKTSVDFLSEYRGIFSTETGHSLKTCLYSFDYNFLKIFRKMKTLSLLSLWLFEEQIFYNNFWNMIHGKNDLLKTNPVLLESSTGTYKRDIEFKISDHYQSFDYQ